MNNLPSPKSKEIDDIVEVLREMRDWELNAQTDITAVQGAITILTAYQKGELVRKEKP